MYKKLSIEFHLRESSRVQETEGHLFIRVIYRRKTCSVTTPYQLFPKEWDKKKKQIILPTDNHSRLSYLKKIEKAMQGDVLFFSGIVSMQEEEDLIFTAKEVVAAYQRRKNGSLLSVYVGKLSDSLLEKKQERTARAYRTAMEALLSFSGSRNLTFDQINSGLIRKFENEMRIKRRSLNTISFYMRNLRAIYNKAAKDRIFKPKAVNPFTDVYTGVPPTRKRALTKEEMKRIVEFEPMDSDLLLAKSLFLFSFYTRGMAFIDIAYLKKIDIKDGILSYKRKKTDQSLEVKLTPPMRQIINLFKKETRNSSYLFPIIIPGKGDERSQYENALQKQNVRLKKLASRCGLRQDLSTHMARHSWATIAKEANLSLPVISEGLGHTSERTTAIYLASFHRKVLDSANEKVMRMVIK